MAKATPKIHHFILLFVTGIVLGALTGLLTNLVNGLVSPLYFRNIMHWGEVAGIHRAVVAQGVFEGALFGTALSLVYTVAVIIASKWACDYRTGARYLLLLFAFVLGFWALGGLIGMGLSALSPEFYRRTFAGVPEDPKLRTAYAWVGGSIWGIEIGAVCTIILGSLLFRLRWKSRAAAD
jgi:hypothetical protein